MKNRCTKTILVFFLVNLFFSSGVWSFGQNPDSDDVVLSTPFLESFDEESYVVEDSVLSERWVLCDSAGNRISWEKETSTFSIGRAKSDGYLYVRNSIRGISYLRSNPIRIEKGKAYLSFFCMSQGFSETEETNTYLLYGKTDNPEQMDTLGCIEQYSENWDHKVFPFESDGGIYYFAFVSARTFVGYRIDALEISSGEFFPHPVLTVVNVELPPSGCGLDTVDIKVKVGNMGTENAEGFVFTCMRNGMETRIFMQDTINVGTVGKELVLNDVPLEKGGNRIGLGFPELTGIGKENMIFNHEPLYPPHRIRLDREEMYVAEGEAEFLGNGEIYSDWIDNKFVSTCFYLEKDVEYGISFLFKGGGIIGQDRVVMVPFHVSVGNSASDYESWEKIWDSTFISLQYQPGETSFSVEEDGLYAFCFGNSAMATVDFYLKDIVIDKKGNMDSYDLGFPTDNSIKLPYSSCGLDHAEIGFRVYNYKSDLNGFSAWYAVNGKDTVEQFFYEKLSKGGMYDFLFSEIAELDTGMNNVTVGLEVYGDIDCKNNVQSMVRYNHQPKHVPHTIDMAKGEMGLSIGENADEWHIGQLNTGEYFIDGCNERVGFSSVCFDLSSDKEYRIEFEYLGGGLFPSGSYYDNCYVKIVPVGESYENGKEIWRENEVLTYDWLEAGSTFSVEENGAYSFVFGLDKSTRGGFSYKNIRVSEVLDYDVRMEFHSQIPNMIPVGQLGVPRKSVADIRNMGKVQAVPVSVKAELGDRTVGMVSTTVVSFTRQELSLDMMDLRVGDTGYVKVEASVIGHEAEDLNMDQSYRGSFVVTDSVMSYYDSDSIFGSSFFSNASIVVNGPSGFALPYFLVSDTLTSVSIGWGGIDSNIVLPNPQLRIYPCEPISGKVKGEPILQQDIKRGYSQGWVVYDIPDMILDGCFLIGVYQMDMQPLGLSFDLQRDGCHYNHYILLNDSVRRDDVLGFPAIRLNLGCVGEVLGKKDIAAESMENPYSHTGAFGSAETIAVVVKNNGSDRYEGLKVRCMVNGSELTPASVDIEPYLSSIAEFTADLSSPNTEYTLTAWVELEGGDENPSNDTIRFELTTVGALDPYVMDFEYCDDFSIDVLQGGWKTVDLDRSPNYGWQLVSFPHTYEAYGFMAFNPVKTQPSIAEDFGMYPYQGRRFGASFAATSGNAKDWLISPKLKMPEKGAKLSFYVKSFSKDYGYDQYKLFVSTTDDKILSFKQIGDLREAPDWEWQYVEQDLGEYAGQEIHVAIQRVQENGYGFVLMIDDIRISKPGASVQRTDISESLSLYPNPAKGKVRLMASLPMTRLQAYDLTGRMVLDRDLGTDCSEYEWDVSSWLPGLYFLNVQTPSGLGSLKLVVKE